MLLTAALHSEVPVNPCFAHSYEWAQQVLQTVLSTVKRCMEMSLQVPFQPTVPYHQAHISV